MADDEEHEYLASFEDNLRAVETYHDPGGRIRVWFGIEHLSYATKETVIEAHEAMTDRLLARRDG